VNPTAPAYEDELKLTDPPLASLSLDQVRPPRQLLTQIMEQLQTGKGMSAAGGGG
jgi:hypothetical protein